MRFISLYVALPSIHERLLRLSQVQSGGSFDVDYSVTGPNDKVILDGTKERQGDFVFTATEDGEYRFCFNNEMSTFAEKTVDFEIAVRLPFHPTTIPETSFFEALSPSQLQRWVSHYDSQYERTMADTNAGGDMQVENEVRAQLPSKQGANPEQTSVLEESLLKLSAQLSTITRMQKYFRTRENRNFSTVKSTEKRIFNFSMMEVGLMVTMAGLQVFIVRFFFQGARKGTILFVWVLGLVTNWQYRLRMNRHVCRRSTRAVTTGTEKRKGTVLLGRRMGRTRVYHHSGILGYGVNSRSIDEIPFHHFTFILLLLLFFTASPLPQCACSIVLHLHRIFTSLVLLFYCSIPNNLYRSPSPSKRDRRPTW